MKSPRRFRSTTSFRAFTSLTLIVGCGIGGCTNGEPGSKDGRTDVVQEALVGTNIRVDQAGYLPGATKIAYIADPSTTPLAFTVISSSGTCGSGTPAASGNTVVFDNDPMTAGVQPDGPSGEIVHQANFTALSTAGSYKVCVGANESYPFVIDPAPYANLARDTLKYFYYNRMMNIDAAYLNDVTSSNGSKHARPHLRQGAQYVSAFLDWTSHKFDLREYHADAGDNSIYPENTAMGMWLLMNLYEKYQADMASFSLNVPESGNTIPDIVDEFAYDGDAMKNMMPLSTDTINFMVAVPPATSLTLAPRLASHKMGYFDWFPYVKDNANTSSGDWGAFTPKRDAYCNYAATSDCVGTACLTPTVSPCKGAYSPCTPAAVNGLVSPPREPQDTALAQLSAAGDNNCQRARLLLASKPSTGATYAVARYLAQLSRLLQPYDATKAASYWTVAKDAYAQAKAVRTLLWKNNMVDLVAIESQDYRASNLTPDLSKGPVVDYNGDGVANAEDYTTPRGSGPYDDATPGDDAYAAAVEMYLTGYARTDASTASYRTDVTGSTSYKTVQRFDWQDDAPLGSLSLLSRSNDLPAADLAAIKDNLVAYSNFIKTAVTSQGYASAIPTTTGFGWTDAEGGEDSDTANTQNPPTSDDPEYSWGSNKFQAYSGMLLVNAYELCNVGTGKPAGCSSDAKDYLKAAYQVLDYLLGANALSRSYVTGWGENPHNEVHHRHAMYVGGNLGATTPKGWMIGGPMSLPLVCGQEETATPTGTAKAKAMLAQGWTAAEMGWCTAEVTIDWQGGMAWLAYALGEKYKSVLGGGGAPATCTDGIKNQTETGVDCGGPCAACVTATCTDGIKNQTETGVDCGGPCAACPSGLANGAACTAGTQCTSANCVDGVCCNTTCGGGSATDCQACNVTGSVGTCSAAPNTVVCRAASQTCDNAENCTGSSTTCPADTFKASGTSCRASAGVCDVGETCTGSSAACPTDVLLSSATVCRASAGACDNAENCSGTAAACPTDTFKASGTSCRAAAGTCDVAESCSGSSAACPSDAFKASGATCDDGSATTCNDACNGTSSTGCAGGSCGGGSTGSGTISWDKWTNQSGTTIVTSLLSTTPNSSGTFTSFEMPLNSGDNYQLRIRGTLTAPSTGSYTFWIAGDDATELRFNSAGSAVSTTVIAYHGG